MRHEQIPLRPIIYVVDDNPSDQLAIKRAIEDASLECDLVTMSDGTELLERIEEFSLRTERSIRDLPDLILLDINMPKMTGISVLEAIKNAHQWCVVPVIVLTTSDSSDDIHNCYINGANAYVTKPSDQASLVEAMKNIEKFWFHTVALPSKQNKAQTLEGDE